jgi:ribonuclease P protein component
MIGRIVRPADFERVLATAPRSRSAHFAVHHVPSGPSLARASRSAVGESPVVPLVSPELSTGDAVTCAPAVDESMAQPVSAELAGHWLGLVVPKRHAKRAVTRNLIKRQVRAAMAAHAPALPPGLWVVRLRMPFDRAQFTSPASEPLKQAARDELSRLFERAVSRPGAAAAGGRAR